MKIIAVIVAVILLGFMILRLMNWRLQTRVHSKSSPEDTYRGLRNLAFQSSRAKLGIPAPSVPMQPWGVIMDWGVTESTATVVAFSDGSASVYFGSGGGWIGGASHESIRKAAQRMVAIAAEYQPQMQATTTYALPQQSQVIFYLLTDAGTFTATASENELSSHQSSLSKLGDAGQDIITQYRLIQ